MGDSQGGTLDEIRVVGKRASIQRALDQKRSATSIVDSIASEELGRFPVQPGTRFPDVEDISTVITDSGIPDDYRTRLQKLGIEVVVTERD